MNLRILFVTSQWPTEKTPYHGPFIKAHIEALVKSGVEIDVYNYLGNWNPLYYIPVINHFHRRLRAKPYNLVYAFFGQCGLVAASQIRIPIVVKFGGSDLIGWKNRDGHEPFASYILRSASRISALRAASIIIVSSELAVHLPKRGYSVIPEGVDLDLFHPMEQEECRNTLGLPLERKLLLFAADPKRVIKRYELAKKATSIASDIQPVELMPVSNVPHKMMPIYMNACDLLLLTSQHEGSPNVVKEALACNLPVVSVDVGDVRERIGSAINCVVCESDDPNLIAEAILKVLNIGKTIDLRKLVLDLSVDQIAQRTIDVLNHTAESRRHERS